ncbi:MAG: DNA-3-methyladenine glycosylase [Gemmatimonadota bacterium]
MSPADPTHFEPGEPLPASFFDRPAELVARELLGAIVVSDLAAVRTAGRIVEAEAYPGPHDPASHAAERIGRTARNEAMHGPPGIAYVYRIYGLHWCLNVVTGRAERPAAVLLRALEPVAGMDAMAERRGRLSDLASGPARLTAALGVSGAQDKHPLRLPPLSIHAGSLAAGESAAAGPRIGVARARDWPLRFWIRDSPFASR